MKLFLIEYDNGLDEELRETKTLGVYDSIKIASDYLLSMEFIQNDLDNLVYIRNLDFAAIRPIELNKPIIIK
jgi:hypothetical protein